MTELIHLPSKHAFEDLREVYNRISTICGYENFTRLPNGARLERGEGETGEISSVTFLNDRVKMVEENIATSLEQISEKFVAVLEGCMPVLKIPFFLVQQYTVRVITTPNTYRQASEFIGKSLFRISNEDVAVLERPTNIFGLRLVFPPTKKQLHHFNVRIESYTRDPRSIYLENVGTFKTPVQRGPQLKRIPSDIQKTSEFLTVNLCRFLSQYDRKEKKP